MIRHQAHVRPWQEQRAGIRRVYTIGNIRERIGEIVVITSDFNSSCIGG